MTALAQQPRLAVLASPGEPLRVVLEGAGEPEPIIDAVGFEALFEDQTPAFRIESVRSAKPAGDARRVEFALAGPAAEQAEVTLLAMDVPRGVWMRWTLAYSGPEKGFFPWTTGFRWAYAPQIEGASSATTTRWVRPTGAREWEVPGDAPYPEFECQVRTVRLAGCPPIAFVTESYDPDWIYGANAERARFVKAVLPRESPSRTTLCMALLTADGAEPEDLAAIAQGRPLSLALGERGKAPLFEPGAQVELPYRVANVSRDPQWRAMSWDVYDYDKGQFIAGGDAPRLAPGEAHRGVIRFPHNRRGVLFVVAALELDAGSAWEQWKTVAILPARRQTEVRPDSPFGLAALIANPELYPEQFDWERVAALAERIGVRWLRCCPFPVKAEVTPEEEQTARDKVETLRRHGILPHVQLSHDLAQQAGWQDTLRATLDRFGGLSDHVEFGNELNPHVDPAEQRAAARKYGDDLLRPFHDLLRQARPAAAVMPHGLGGIEAAYLDGWGESGAWDLIDVLSVHPGSFPRAPEWDHPGEFWSLIPQLRTLKGAFAKYGEKPYWVTEIYAPTPPGKYGLDLRTSAEYLIRTYMVCLEWGAQVIEWYQFQDGVWFAPIPKPTDVEYSFGLLYSDLSPKPAYVAYGTMTSQLDGLRFMGRRDLGDADLYAYAFGDDGVPAVHVMWSYREKHELDGSWAEIADRSRRPAMPWESRDGGRQFVSVPAPGPVSAVDLMGNPVQVPTLDGKALLNLSGSPIFVRGLAELPLLPPP